MIVVELDPHDLDSGIWDRGCVRQSEGLAPKQQAEAVDTHQEFTSTLVWEVFEVGLRAAGKIPRTAHTREQAKTTGTPPQAGEILPEKQRRGKGLCKISGKSMMTCTLLAAGCTPCGTQILVVHT